MSIPPLNEATLRRHAADQVFERGKAYYQAGAVSDLRQRGNTLQAEVEGSEVEPYIVRLTFDGVALATADCSCAYAFEGWCKHIVATALVCLHQPELIEERPTLECLLERLDLPQTRAMVQELVAEQPRQIEVVDAYVQRLAEPTPRQPATPATSATSPRRTAVDPAPYRGAVQQILRRAVRDWEAGRDDDSIQEDMLAVIEKAQDLTRHGDGPNALVVLEAITRACVDYWDEVAEYGAESDDLVAALDQAWTEAILSSERTPTEKANLEQHLTAWQEELGGSVAMSLEALRQGWDYPPLQRVLQGQMTELGAWDRQAPDYAKELALIRLNILDRQQRYQEYLHLAEAESQCEQYLTMLVRLGQVAAAMAAASTQLDSLETAFALARMLREKEALAPALVIAQAGLNLPGQAHRQYELAVWASALAEDLGDVQAALSARIAAFSARPSLGDYQKAVELAGAAGATVRTELLQRLLQYRAWDSDSAKVDIFLQEGMLDDAIAVVKDLGYYQADLVKRVMAAALNQRPAWVIENAVHRAEEIIDAARANAYHHAVDWLKQARAAYLASGQQAAWQGCRTRLMRLHARKYKLLEMLKQRDLA